ncbi:BglII/BstYI family type II restriction endonuclease [Priestia aryabhattai]|uniref:BglII/BstYI family type II restriction endonuclease n=1 Tax=Priestia aryabhattai TaxID=412384 RepID=UPI003D2DEA1E
MKYEIYSHRYAWSILEGEQEFRETWDEILEIIEGITDQMIINKFQEKYEGKNKSLSSTLNDLFKLAFVAKGWAPESPIFQDKHYSDNVWRLDFAKTNISVEVAFNHSGVIAWNLLKPVLASELNHVEKAIQTKIGVIICATRELQLAGNFDSAIGTYEKYIHHLIPLNNQLSVPIAIIGLKAPETFEIQEYKEGNRKLGRVVERTLGDVNLSLEDKDPDLDELLDE